MLLTEVDVADKLLQFRSMQAGFLDTSFDTISGTLTSIFIIFFLLIEESNFNIRDSSSLVKDLVTFNQVSK